MVPNPAVAVISLTKDSNLGTGYRLLVAEDHEIDQTIISGLLEGAGVQVDVAGDGRSDVATALTTQYDAVLMAIHLPIMDRVEATSQLRVNSSAKGLRIYRLDRR